ncbi:MAG: hypothetical protein WC757_04295 [Candidatus Paceibacterota bacterium]|jgi:hypothetical protein
MIEFKYIYENEIGITCFDKYFEYLDGIKTNMPKNIREFATDKARYTLSGDLTIHDSWLKAINFEKTFAGEMMVTDVRLGLLQATHKKELWLNYSGATGYSCSLLPNRWPFKPIDLLTHEFTMLDKGLFKHAVQFDRGVWFEVTFSNFELTEYSH